MFLGTLQVKGISPKASSTFCDGARAQPESINTNVKANNPNRFIRLPVLGMVFVSFIFVQSNPTYFRTYHETPPLGRKAPGAVLL